MHKMLVIAVGLVGVGTVGVAQENAVITDGNRPFTEGILLTGYVVQDDGETLCTDPFVIGKYISCAESISVDGQIFTVPSRQTVWADTNGTLGAMIVLGVSGRVHCQGPTVSNQFRGPTSYVICN